MRKEEFVIPGKPHGKARPRFYNGHAYNPESNRAYDNLIAVSWGEKESFGTTPLRVWIDAYYPYPSGSTKTEKELMRIGEIKPVGKPDLDNCIKAILDGLNGLAWHDDKQIVSLHAKKHYGDARVEVIIEECIE